MDELSKIRFEVTALRDGNLQGEILNTNMRDMLNIAQWCGRNTNAINLRDVQILFTFSDDLLKQRNNTCLSPMLKNLQQFWLLQRQSWQSLLSAARCLL